MRLKGIRGRFKYACHGQFVGSSVRMRSNLQTFSKRPQSPPSPPTNSHFLTQKLADCPSSIGSKHQVDTYISDNSPLGRRRAGLIGTSRRTRTEREDSGPHPNQRDKLPRTSQGLIQLVQEPQCWGVVALDLVVHATLWAFEGFLCPRLVLLGALDPMK